MQNSVKKLIPAVKDYLWGGNRLKNEYHKNSDGEILAETWELSCHADGPTLLENGQTLESYLTPEKLGANALDFSDERGGYRFPMLLKFIDAKENLSIQVHPDDKFALDNEKSFGKTEMWYVLDAKEGAGIYLGFSNKVGKKEIEDAIRDEKLTDLLDFRPVKAGDCFYIPSGTVHAILSGVLICELQQNSNLTYRVYDYGRRGKDGKTRPLHVEKALRVMIRGKWKPSVLPKEFGDRVLLGCSRYFTAERLDVRGGKTLRTDGSTFYCVSCLEGSGAVGGAAVRKGDSVFVGANAGSVDLSGEMTLFLSSVRKYSARVEDGFALVRDDLGRVLLREAIPAGKDPSAFALSLAKKCNLTANDLIC